VGEAGGRGRDVLDDHVDVGTGAGDHREQAGGGTRDVGDPLDGDLALAAVVRDPGDDRVFHAALLALGVVVVADPGPHLGGEGGSHVDGHPVAAGVLDRSQVQDLGPVR